MPSFKTCWRKMNNAYTKCSLGVTQMRQMINRLDPTTHLDLRFLPLVNVGLFDFKVDSFNPVCSAHDLDPAQVWLEVV